MTVKNQFLKNLVINGLNFVVRFLLGFLIPPLIINNLGISSFGVFQIAISVGIYMGLVANSLNQANARFLAVNIERGNKVEINKVLVTIFALYVILILVLLPVLVLISTNINLLLNNKPIQKDLGVLFFLVGLSSIFVVLESAFLSIIYVRNRLDIVKLVNILRNSLRLFYLYSFMFLFNSIIGLGVSYFLADFIAVLLSYRIFRKYTPYFKFKLSFFDKILAKDILAFSFWTLIGLLGNLIFLQMDIILTGKFLGTQASGVYALLVQWGNLLTSLVAILSVVIAPLILIAYAKDQFERVKSIFYQSIRYQGLYVMIFSTIIFVYAERIFKFWVGEDYVYLSDYLRIFIIFFGLSQALRQIHTLSIAYNKVKFQGGITLFFGILHIIACLFILKYSKLGILGVLLSNVFFSTTLNLIVFPLYASKHFDISKDRVFKEILTVISMSLFYVILALAIKTLFNPDSLGNLILALILSLALNLLLTSAIIVKDIRNREIFWVLRSK